MDAKAELRERRQARRDQHAAERRDLLLTVYGKIRSAAANAAWLAMVLIWITSFLLGLWLILPCVSDLFRHGVVERNDSSDLGAILWAVTALSYLALRNQR